MTIWLVAWAMLAFGAVCFWLGGRYVLAQIPLREAAARQALYEAREAELRALEDVLARMKEGS